MAVNSILRFAGSSLSVLLMLSACASTPNEPKSKMKSAAKLDDRLKPRNLSDGECGVFVWTSDPARRFVFFSQDLNPTASWWGPSGEEKVTRTAGSGVMAFEQSPEQSFNLSDGGLLKVSLFDPEEADNGTRFKSGSIAHTGSDGWEKVIPVFGVAACNLKPVGAKYSMRTTRT